MSDGKKPVDFDRAVATFQARLLHALEPVIRASQEDILRWPTTGLMVEPIESGGCALVATDGHILAAILDPSARATRAMRIKVSDDLFAAVKPPDDVRMFDQGEHFSRPLPEWAQPGIVYAWGLAAFVLPKMHYPEFEPGDAGMLAHVRAEEGNTYAGGYRIHAEPPTLPWRKILNKARSPAVGRLNFYPQTLNRFERIERLYGNGVEVSLGGEGEPIILTIPGAPEFIGAMIPCKTEIEAPPLPAWVTASVAASSATLASEA